MDVRAAAGGIVPISEFLIYNVTNTFLQSKKACIAWFC